MLAFLKCWFCLCIGLFLLGNCYHANALVFRQNLEPLKTYQIGSNKYCLLNRTSVLVYKCSSFCPKVQSSKALFSTRKITQCSDNSESPSYVDPRENSQSFRKWVAQSSELDVLNVLKQSEISYFCEIEFDPVISPNDQCGSNMVCQVTYVNYTGPEIGICYLSSAKHAITYRSGKKEEKATNTIRFEEGKITYVPNEEYNLCALYDNGTCYYRDHIRTDPCPVWKKNQGIWQIESAKNLNFPNWTEGNHAVCSKESDDIMIHEEVPGTYLYEGTAIPKNVSSASKLHNILVFFFIAILAMRFGITPPVIFAVMIFYFLIQTEGAQASPVYVTITSCHVEYCYIILHSMLCFLAVLLNQYAQHVCLSYCFFLFVRRNVAEMLYAALICLVQLHGNRDLLSATFVMLAIHVITFPKPRKVFNQIMKKCFPDYELKTKDFGTPSYSFKVKVSQEFIDKMISVTDFVSTGAVEMIESSPQLISKYAANLLLYTIEFLDKLPGNLDKILTSCHTYVQRSIIMDQHSKGTPPSTFTIKERSKLDKRPFPTVSIPGPISTKKYSSASRVKPNIKNLKNFILYEEEYMKFRHHLYKLSQAQVLRIYADCPRIHSRKPGESMDFLSYLPHSMVEKIYDDEP